MPQRLTELQRKILVASLGIEEKAKLKYSGTPIFDLMSKFSPQDIADAIGLLDQPIMHAQVAPKDLPVINKRVNAIFEKVRQAMISLCRKGLLQRDKMPRYRGKKNRIVVRAPCYRLTDMGRLLAKIMRFEMEKGTEFEEAKAEHLKNAIEALKRKTPVATPEEILMALWPREADFFGGDQELFHRHWTKKKLGAEMKKLGYRLVRARRGEKLVWAYELYTEDERMKDMKSALVSVRKQNCWRARTGHIREALRRVCGHKFDPEGFEKAWPDEAIGRCMHKLGLRRIQPRDIISGREQEVRARTRGYDIRTVPGDEGVEW